MHACGLRVLCACAAGTLSLSHIAAGYVHPEPTLYDKAAGLLRSSGSKKKAKAAAQKKAEEDTTSAAEAGGCE